MPDSDLPGAFEVHSAAGEGITLRVQAGKPANAGSDVEPFKM
jgi:hypothetical protein